jgi:hypothetical protein
MREKKNWEYTTNQKDFDDFFTAEPDIEGALAPVDFYAGRVRVACQYGNRKVTSPDQRLDEQKDTEKICVTSEYEFDR